MAKQKITTEITTEEEALAAVKKNGMALQYVPENLKTAEMCLEAVKKNIKALQFVPDKLMTAEICLKAVRQDGTTLKKVPEKFKTAEVCLEAVKDNIEALQYVPEKLIGESPKEFGAVCLEAVKENIEALQFVPEKLITESLKEFCAVCLEAVKKDIRALQYVPEKLIKESQKEFHAICLKEAKSNISSYITLQYAPESLKTEELCLESVRQYGEALQYVPENLKTAEVCLKAVKRSGHALKYVPENLKTASPKEFGELCIEAVKKSGTALHYVPENLKTAELCIEAVKESGHALEYVPENLKTAELCIEAVKENRLALVYVPKKLMTVEMCIEVIKDFNSRIESTNNAYDKYGMRSQVLGKIRGDICGIFEKIPEELREEARRRLEYEGIWRHAMMRMSNVAAEINIRAQNQEGIRFEFDKLSERKSDFVADKIKVFVTIPDSGEVPKSINVKLTNIGKTEEQRETVINCKGRVSKAELEGIVILRVEGTAGKSAERGYKYRQKAEITFNFENRSEPLTCPISRTTTFGMCFYDAYEDQTGKLYSVDSICEFPE